MPKAAKKYLPSDPQKIESLKKHVIEKGKNGFAEQLEQALQG